MRNLKQNILLSYYWLCHRGDSNRKLYNTENGLSSRSVSRQRGFIWVATRNGLNVFDIMRCHQPRQLRITRFDSNYINKVEQDHLGKYFLGSNKGLLSFDGQQFHAYKIYNDQHKLVKTYVNDTGNGRAHRHVGL